MAHSHHRTTSLFRRTNVTVRGGSQPRGTELKQITMNFSPHTYVPFLFHQKKRKTKGNKTKAKV